MPRWVVHVLRGVIATALLGSVVVQVGAVVLLATAPPDERGGIELGLGVVAVLGVGTLQVVAVGIWRLLTMASRSTVFTPAAFRWVDLVIGALVAGALLVVAVAVLARFANHATPGDAVAPGVIALVCGLALVVAGVALVVYVLRTLLAQAVSLDTETRQLQSELDGVI